MMEITLLGCAGAVPLPDRALTSCVLTVGGRSILFDCGEGTQTSARRAGINLMRVDVIALTHYHGDHIFGIPGLLQSMDLAGRTDPLYIVGPVREGLSIEYELSAVLALSGRPGYELRLLAMPAEGLDMRKLSGDWPHFSKFRAFPTVHRVCSQGYVFELGRRGRFLPEKAKETGVPVKLWNVLQNGEDILFDGRTVRSADVTGPERKGLKFVFSGDTGYCRQLADNASGADLFVCESTYGDDDQSELAAGYGHMTFSQAGRAASEAGAARLWLTHFSQRIRNPEEFMHFAREQFPDAEAGYDGKRISLQFE